MAVPVLFGVFVLALMFAFGGREARDPVAIALLYIVPSVLCFSLAKHPLRFALSLGALMVASSLYVSAHEHVPFRGRSFFGVYRVVDDADRRLRLLVHGRTIHGAQSLDSARSREPLTYYHRSGPIGQAFASFRGEHSKPRVAIVGLGIGSLAAYGLRGQQWTFYEIDPSIAALARDARYFTFVRDSQADVRIVLGDGRISLTNEPSSNVDLLVVDAFSSDAIPVHLITREALDLYWQALDPHGLLAFHISNRYLDFQPLLGDLARDAGLVSLAQDDFELDKADESGGKTPSRWVLMARSADALGLLANDTRWHPLSAQVRPVVWTDEFSNPLALVKWYR